MNNYEICAVIKDAKNKRIKMHINMNISQEISNNIQLFYAELVNRIEFQDQKHMTGLFTSIKYEIKGIIDLESEEYDKTIVVTTLHSLESKFIQAAEMLIFVINNMPRLDLILLRTDVELLIGIYLKLKSFSKIEYSTRQQKEYCENTFYRLVNTYNIKVKEQIRNISENNNKIFFGTSMGWIHPMFSQYQINDNNYSINLLKPCIINIKVKEIETDI